MAVILEIYIKIAVCGIASVFGLGEHDNGVCRTVMWVKSINFLNMLQTSPFLYPWSNG